MKTDNYRLFAVYGTFIVAAGLYLCVQILQLKHIYIQVGEITSDSGEISESELPVTESGTVAKMLFTGDVMLGRNVEFLSDIHGYEYPFAFIDSVFKEYQTVIINFESAAADPHTRTRSGGFQFSTKENMIGALGSIGVTHASLANNHGLDYGESGYKRAASLLKSNGISSFGHPVLHSTSTSVQIITQAGKKVAVVGLHTLFRIPTSHEVNDILAYAESLSDFQIIFIHWGDEYQLVHNAAQERLAKIAIDSGADAVIGHHPHVVQDIQVYKEVPIFYSLGNFIFDQYFSSDVQEGYLLEFSLDEDVHFSIIPVTSKHSRSQPQLMSDEEKGDFLTLLAGRSDSALVENILSGSLTFRKRLATSTQTSMIAQ